MKDQVLGTLDESPNRSGGSDVRQVWKVLTYQEGSNVRREKKSKQIREDQMFSVDEILIS